MIINDEAIVSAYLFGQPLVSCFPADTGPAAELTHVHTSFQC